MYGIFILTFIYVLENHRVFDYSTLLPLEWSREEGAPGLFEKVLESRKRERERKI